MSSDLLIELLQALDAPQGQFAELERYATGQQQLAFISPESRKALGNRLYRMASNIPALAINSIVERLRLTGFSDSRAWPLFTASDLDQLAAQAMRDALLYGTGYVLVWSKDGKPVASVESPRECAVIRDPADRSVVAGVKRYRTKRDTHAYIYLADRIEHWVADTPGAGTAGFVLVDVVDNPLGVVPLVPIDNGDTEIRDVIPLTDALVKLLTDMMVASEAAGKPRRWISGLELVQRPVLDEDGNALLGEDGQPVLEVVSPIPSDEINTIQTMVSSQPETKFGQPPASDLSGFKEGVQVIISQLSAVSSLPAHYLSPLSAAQVPSADGLRAAEASLTARAESKQRAYGRAWEQVARLLIAVATGVHPAEIHLRVQWASAATRSVSQEADAAVKLYQSGLLSREETLRRLGFAEDEISAELARINRDTADARDLVMGRYVSSQLDR